MQEFIVTEDQDDSRADKILKEISPNVSYIFLQKIFRTHKVKVNRKKIKASDHLHAGDKIQIFANLFSCSENLVSKRCDPKLFERFKKMIIFENENLIAINKPAGLAVQPGTKVTICIETMIKAHPNCKCHLVHRLDKETSGILIIAKNLSTAKKLSAMFRENKIKKTYLAIVDGKILKSGIINASIDDNEAITKYTPLKNFENYTLLKLNPKTGRKHQLRIHCAKNLKAPICGDKKYNLNCSHPKMFLHAYKIFIEEMKLEIISQIPEYFFEIFDLSELI